MRVICINSDAWPDCEMQSQEGSLKDGEVYNVIDVYFDEGYIWYVVEGDEDGGYWENCFARLQDEENKSVWEKAKEKVFDFFNYGNN